MSEERSAPEDDIVGRLRNPPEASWAALMTEAADEIAVLRAALRPFAEAYRKHGTEERVPVNVSIIIDGKHFARAAELVPDTKEGE